MRTVLGNEESSVHHKTGNYETLDDKSINKVETKKKKKKNQRKKH